MTQPTNTHPAVAISRGLTRRCPRCGLGGLFTRWFTMAKRCPRCGLAFERGEGFWLGAMAINLGVTEAVFGASFVIAAVLRWPHVPWAWLTVAAVAMNVVIPILFYPFSQTIFLAIDLVLHQIDNPQAHELEDAPPT
jgi:uncharacterized protein (DUF983 family)